METWSKKCTRCVGYLPERTHQAWNKNSRVKLHKHETKLCIRSAWFLMHLPSHGTKEHCVVDGVIVYYSLDIYFLPCKMLVATNTLGVLNEFWKDFFYLLHTSILQGKNQVQRCNEHGSQNACHHFISFFRENLLLFSFFTKGFFFS